MNQEIIPGYYRISAKALVLSEDKTKLLLVRSEDDAWDLTGGGMKWGESAHECITREVMEEMGVTVISTQEQPSYFFPVVNDMVKYAYVVYEVVLSGAEFVPSDECIEIRFVTPEEVRALSLRPNVNIFLDVFKK
jgi:8-oxo-dGTP diphosphatase